jgi:hypothetical protein
VVRLAKQQGEIDRVSVGFPGVVRKGVVETAHNLGRGIGFDLDRALTKALGKPVRACNDADVQGLGVCKYDTLYIGGGNAKKVTGDLPARVRVISNVAGLLGGIALWEGKENSYGVR